MCGSDLQQAEIAAASKRTAQRFDRILFAGRITFPPVISGVQMLVIVASNPVDVL